MAGVTVCDHPLLARCVTSLRDEATPSPQFREGLRRSALLLAAEATRGLPIRRVPVRTPLETAEGAQLEGGVLLVVVLRAGLGLLDGFRELVPDARVGFIGLKRDEATLEAVNYHASLPDELGGLEVFLLDPMLATGGSAVAALDLLAARRPRSLRLVSLVAAPEGVSRVHAAHPGVPILCGALDRELNEKGYILPGLGDAGDRMFGV
ncbi:MAG: uracil phosphoribosyltransferase [Limisphaerales bacterium]